MSRFQESVEIKCPVNQVFAFATDIQKLTQWDTAISNVEQISEGPVSVGTTFKGANKAIGRQMPWTSRVTEYEPNKKWEEVISSGATQITLQLYFGPWGLGTRFTQICDVKAAGFLKLLTPFLASSMRKQTRASLGNLKGLLEGQAK
jgi:hypothetical protein